MGRGAGEVGLQDMCREEMQFDPAFLFFFCYEVKVDKELVRQQKQEEGRLGGGKGRSRDL